MASLFRPLIRIWAFIAKEAAVILRQPRLIVTLILGPFLILLLFGLGYSGEPLLLRTLFVVQEGSELRPYVEQYAESFVKQLVFEGTTPNAELAKTRLRSDDVDVVVVLPDNVSETIRNSEQAVITVLHDEIDPMWVRYVVSFSDVLVNELNRRVLQVLAEEGQQEASAREPGVESARRSTQALREAMESGDSQAREQHLGELDQNLTDLESALLVSGVLLGGLNETEGEGSTGRTPDEILADLRRQVGALEEPDADPRGDAEDQQALADIEEDLTLLETVMEEFRSIDSSVLVTPFTSTVQNVREVDIGLVDFYVPAVIAVLLQHLCVTFGALSIVREKRSGSMELFQASPLSPFEVLTGKYLSYLVFTVLLTALLTVLLKYVLGMPMLGDLADYAWAVLALLFASLGLGFVLSLLANTTSQAVQYSMLALLITVFFSGFFLGLELLRPEVRVVSWATPATYGIRLFQDILLRGRAGELLWLGILVGIGVILAVLAWLLLRRMMRRS